MMVTPLHKIYETWPTLDRGYVDDLYDALPIVRRYWPSSYMEGSAGLARMFIDRDTRLFVAYAWGYRRKDGMRFKYLVFPEGMQW